MSGILSQVMRSQTEGLKGSKADTALIDHKGLMGSLRERSFRKVLRKFLPAAFEIGSGEVVNRAGQRSRQQDCLIVDRLTTVPLLIEEDEGVYPIESIRGSVELKSAYTADVLDTAIKNVASVKSLVGEETAPSWSPFGSVVCYPGRTATKTVARSFQTKCLKLEPHKRPDALLVVGQCLLVWGVLAKDDEGSHLVPRPATASSELYSLPAHDALLDWFCILVDSLRAAPSLQADLFQYVNSERPELEIDWWPAP